MSLCEGVDPERTISTPVAALNDQGEPVILMQEEVIPAAPCTAEATVLSRSMAEELCEADHPCGSPHLYWRVLADRRYCQRCYVPGQVTHRDGSISQHAPMVA